MTSTLGEWAISYPGTKVMTASTWAKLIETTIRKVLNLRKLSGKMKFWIDIETNQNNVDLVINNRHNFFELTYFIHS